MNNFLSVVLLISLTANEGPKGNASRERLEGH